MALQYGVDSGLYGAGEEFGDRSGVARLTSGTMTGELESAASWDCRVASWLGGTLLEASITIMSGRVTARADQRVPERLKFTVPWESIDDGRTISWLPATPSSPLARYGQIADLTIIPAGVETHIGRYLISEWSETDSGISVTADGLLQLAADDRFTEPTGPRDDGTLRSEFARILPGYLSAAFDSDLVDRPVPSTVTWDQDRLKAMYDIADAWPARIRTDSWGTVQALAPLPTVFPIDEALVLTDGEGGTVVSSPTSDTREGIYNMVVARSTADGVEASAVAAIGAGDPMSPTGQYRPVPYFLSSPLLGDESECLAAAQTRLADVRRSAAVVQVTMAPDIRAMLDTPVRIIRDKDTPAETSMYGWVVGYDHPLTVNDGPSRIDVAVM